MKWWPRLRAAHEEIARLKAALLLAENDADLARQNYIDQLDALPDRLLDFLESDEQSEDVDREARNDAYRRVFGTPDGRIILRDLAKSCHVLTPTLASGANGMDAGLTGFQEGQRWAFQRIWRLSNSAPSAGGKSE